MTYFPSLFTFLIAIFLAAPLSASADDLDDLLDYLITSEKAEKAETKEAVNEDATPADSEAKAVSKQAEIGDSA